MRWGVVVLALSAAGCGRIAFGPLVDGGADVATFTRAAYIKPADTSANLQFGLSLALSDDGSVLAVGAPLRGGEAGAVYMFRRIGETWVQEQVLTASNADPVDQFGWSVALATDGATLVVGARREDGGMPTDPSDNSVVNAGAAYVFRYTSGWSEVAYVKATIPTTGAAFGERVAISGDASIIAVGAPDENNAEGRAHFFDAAFQSQGAVAGSNVDAGDANGYRLAVSATGLAIVGAYREDSAMRGVPAFPSNDSAPSSGASYAFTRAGTLWSESVAIKSSDSVAGDNFGYAIAITPDAAIAAIAAEGAQVATGAIYMFSTSPWQETAILRATDRDPDDQLGFCLSMTQDGGRVAAGAIYEDSAAIGFEARPGDNDAPDSGAVYLFDEDVTGWQQTRFIKATNTSASDNFGWACALSGSGDTLAVSAPFEDGGGTGVDAASNDDALDAGAVYVFY